MTLTADQRWLLWTVGGSIARPILHDHGLQHFMSTCSGYLGTARDGAPEWLSSYETRGKAIYAPSQREPRVTVTAKDIQRFRDEIPPAVRAELAAVDKAEMDEHWRTVEWCLCPGEPPHRDRFNGPLRYHPSDDEYDEHLGVVHTLWDRERSALWQALGLDEHRVGQLDLFEAAS